MFKYYNFVNKLIQIVKKFNKFLSSYLFLFITITKQD